MFKVACPYCTFGHAFVDVEKLAGAHKVDKSPRQCVSCGHYFDIEVRVNLRGVPLAAVDRNKATRQSLRKLVEEQL